MQNYMDGVSVVIPCLNERVTVETAVRDALSAIQKTGLPGEVIVADNGSLDGTQEIAKKAGARVVDVKEKGYGSALHGGISAAQYSRVAFADADLSYPFFEVPNLVRVLDAGKVDFVLGSRLRGQIEPRAMPLLNRYVGTPILSLLIRRLYALNTSDCNSGMRIMRTEIYRNLDLRCPGMEYASEMLIRVGQLKVSYAETPIQFKKDQRGRAPHLRRWRDGWRHLRFILGNASSLPIVVFPAILSALLFVCAFAISLQGGEAGTIRYHSAFISIALAMPLLLFSLSCAMVKMVLHMSGQRDSRVSTLIQKISDRNLPIMVSLFFIFLTGAEVCWVFYKWYRSGFGFLDEMPSVIRIMIFVVVASALFSMDLSLGVLRLIPYKKKGDA